MNTKHTLSTLVRNQILAEGPDDYLQAADMSQRDAYIDEQLNHMRKAELLERISDALVELQKPHDQRQWL